MVGVTNTFEDVGWFSRAWYLSEHCGTHVDAPLHFNPVGSPVDQIPLENLFGDAILLNFAHKRAGEDVTPEEVETAIHVAGVSPGAARIVLIRSDRSKLWGQPEYQRDVINMTPEATEWLLQRGIRVVGCDMCVWEVDRRERLGAEGIKGSGAERFPAHALMRRYDFGIIENLTNLDQITVPLFTFIGFPLRLVGGSASPIRATAILPG